MFKEKLLEIEQELKSVYKVDIMTKVVINRLDVSLSRYIKNLEQTCRDVLVQSPKAIKVLLNKK